MVSHVCSRHRQDGDVLPFLSQEEQECLQFFEDTIDSLEESLEEDEPRPVRAKPPPSSNVPGTDGPPVTSSLESKAVLSSLLARPPSPKEQDIIDLVCPEPDLVQTKEPIDLINPGTMQQLFVVSSTFLLHFETCPPPDFQSTLPSPDRHFEDKKRPEPVDHLPSEYNPPLPSGSYDLTDGHPSYHPPGSIPTPVLIAHKIAENQSSGNSSLLSSSILSRRSPESPSSSVADPPSKQGPPTSAKPTRFPANISVCLGQREHQNQPLANVNIQERRAQMLANLSGTSHPLVEELKENDEQKARNVPTRSVSFRDPTPEKSRMEALSKLGLTRNRAMSGGTSLPSISVNPPADAETVDPSEAGVPLATESAAQVAVVNTPTPAPSRVHEDRKPEILQADSPKNHEPRQPQLTPPPSEHKAPAPPPPEVASLEFNTYGGKSIVVNPAVIAKGEPASPPTSPEPKALPSVLANPSEFNSYGGKSKVLTRMSTPATRSDLPDILSSHIDPFKSHTRSELPPPELNSYGGKSRSINASGGLNRPSTSSARTLKPPAPSPAPRPARHSYHSTPPRASRALSPDHKRRSNSMFRPQGITVQFSGRGKTDESRREALRKLGLLKES